MLLSTGHPIKRTASLPSPEVLPRRSLDATQSILGFKPRRISLEARAAETDAVFLTSSAVARAERAGLLEVGRSVDLDEQRLRLERNWNTEEYQNRDEVRFYSLLRIPSDLLAVTCCAQY